MWRGVHLRVRDAAASAELIEHPRAGLGLPPWRANCARRVGVQIRCLRPDLENLPREMQARGMLGSWVRDGEGKVLAGFAGSTADAITLFEKFEAKWSEFPGNLARAAVEMAKEWRTDKFLRHLEALLVVADEQQTLVITGRGDVLSPDGGATAIGSGGNFALAAARALLDATELSAHEITRRSLTIAGDICVYTNKSITMLELPSTKEA